MAQQLVLAGGVSYEASFSLDYKKLCFFYFFILFLIYK